MKKILATGTAGFIGSNFVKRVAIKNPEIQFILLDALTYAGIYESIEDELKDHKNLSFVKMNLLETERLKELFNKENFDGVIHFAAESHVDNSIKNPNLFVETNVLGTLNLLNNSLKLFEKNPNFRFVHVSTDEVYGSLKEGDAAFTEEHPIVPNSPYSASKASSDLLVRSFYETYKLPVMITRCSNNYGPYQFPEKLIPLMISNAQKNIPLPVYGDGRNIRDWIHVFDHVDGVWAVYQKGKAGEVYNLGGNAEMRNIEIVKRILDQMGLPHTMIKFVEDRKGHDWRYAMNYSKIEKELGWKPKMSFQEGLSMTIEWYQSNIKWLEIAKKRKLSWG